MGETMSDEQVTMAQLKTLQAEFSRLKREDDPRVNGPDDERFSDDRDGRIAWANACLGMKKLDSFSNLSFKQAEYLIDVLKKGHTLTKLDGFIGRELQRMGVEDPEAYFQGMLEKKNYWTYGGRSLATLNRWQKMALARLLSTRGASPARARGSAPSPRARVSEEQNQLWPGM